MLVKLQVVQEISVPNRPQIIENAAEMVEMGFFSPTWASADVSYLLPGQVSEDTDKIQAAQKSI